MAEFLEMVESIRAEQASVERLFAGEGEGVRTGRKGKDPAHLAKVAEAAQFVADLLDGSRPAHQLREVMTTSDFPYLFGDVMDRMMLAAYREYPTYWTAFARQTTVADFRSVKRFASPLGLDGELAAVAEKAEYPVAALTEASPYTYAVGKYGRRVDFSWESIINDDLEALRDTPARLGRAARRTEARFVTKLYVDASGPHASFYTSGNANIITSNAVLSITGLQTAMGQLAAKTSTINGQAEPIWIEAVTLVVPPSLEITALNILNAINIIVDTNASAGTAQQNLTAQNWMRNRVRLVVDPFIPLVASSANGTTSWFLFAQPGENAALEIGHLRGHVEPEIWMKSPNAVRVGGGAVNPMDGDFDTDNVIYRVRHVLGGCRLDPVLTMGSNGSGSA